MFTINSISIRNFTSITTLDMSFEEDSITLISGDNGSGKSSLLNAINFVVFGHKEADKFSDYIQAGQDEATVHLDGLLKGYPITYDVSIKSTVTREVSYKGVTYRNSDYDQFIVDEGLDKVHPLMFVSSNGTSLVTMKPTERANALKSLFHIDFSSQVEDLKDKIEESKVEVSKMKASIDELSAVNLELLPLRRPKPQSSIDAEKTELRALGDSLHELEGISEKTLSVKRGNVRKKEYQIEDLKSKIDSLQKKHDREHQEFLKAKGYLEEHPEGRVRTALSKAERELDTHTEEWNKLREAYNALDKEVYSTKGSLRELDEQIEIGRKGFCHSCGQPVDESHISKLVESRKGLSDKLDKLNKEISDLGFDPYDKGGSDLKKKVKEAEKAVSDMEEMFRVQDTHWDNAVECLQSIHDKEETLMTYETELDGLREDCRKLEGLTSQLEHKNELQARYDALESQIEEDIRALGAFREQKEQNERIRERRTQRDERVQKLNESVNDLTKEMNLNKTCVEILDKALPTYMLLKACATLEDYINGVVGKLFPYLKVKLQAKGKGVEFYILTESSEDKWVSAKLASGAQKAILNLSFSIAIAQIYGVSSIFLDEVDASMNGRNSKLVYEFLSKVEGFNQVVFVSNRQESIDVAKENGATCYYVEHGDYEMI